MGSCVSFHKDPESVIKFKPSFGSKSDKLVMPSPINDKALNNGDRPIGELGLKPQQSYPSRDFGSKEDNFFDSQAWLDSDCDDDFLSVNGEFTPSRGNTPVHHSFAPGISGVNKAFFEDSGPRGRPEPSPTDKKTRLSDLFKESLRVNQDLDENNTSGSLNETPYASGVQSSERTPIGKFKPDREKSTKSQCCLPSLRSNRSFSDRKKKMSPYRKAAVAVMDEEIGVHGVEAARKGGGR